MSPLYCSVCKKQYFGRSKWLRHLTQEAHQNQARKGFLMKEADLKQNERYKSCVVVFTALPLTSGHASSGLVLEYFEAIFDGDEEAALVTDFVWWADRPYMGIVQFESMNKVEEVLQAIDIQNGSRPPITIRLRGDHYFQIMHVKAGFELPSLEWRGILPVLPYVSSSAPPIQQSSLYDNPEAIEEEPQETDYANVSNPIPKSLQTEFQAIKEMMLIPNSQTIKISTAMTSLKTTISTLDPILQVAPFRKGVLKLNSPSDNDNKEDSLCHVYTLGEQTSFEVDTKVKEHFAQNETEFKLVREYPDQLTLVHLPTSVRITLVTPKRQGCLAEVQVCRLMEYLCRFDPRCHSLITLVSYWVTLNGVDVNIAGTGDQGALPSQYTIKWLVLFFLSNKNYIPTVREVMEANPVDYLRDEESGENIGFLSDPGYVGKWKELQMETRAKKAGLPIPVGGEDSNEFILNVLQLLRRFLGTMGKFLGKKKWIFNTMDGVQVGMSRFCEMDGRKWVAKAGRWENVKEEEAERLKEALGKCEMRREIFGGEIWMTHPFLWGQRIGVEVREEGGLRKLADSMMMGERKLGGFLRRVDEKGGKDGNGAEELLEMEGGFENLLKI